MHFMADFHEFFSPKLNHFLLYFKSFFYTLHVVKFTVSELYSDITPTNAPPILFFPHTEQTQQINAICDSTARFIGLRIQLPNLVNVVGSMPIRDSDSKGAANNHKSA